jgi:hypothetical protein
LLQRWRSVQPPCGLQCVCCAGRQTECGGRPQIVHHSHVQPASPPEHFHTAPNALPTHTVHIHFTLPLPSRVHGSICWCVAVLSTALVAHNSTGEHAHGHAHTHTQEEEGEGERGSGRLASQRITLTARLRALVSCGQRSRRCLVSADAWAWRRIGDGRGGREGRRW